MVRRVRELYYDVEKRHQMLRTDVVQEIAKIRSVMDEQFAVKIEEWTEVPTERFCSSIMSFYGAIHKFSELAIKSEQDIIAWQKKMNPSAKTPESYASKERSLSCVNTLLSPPNSTNRRKNSVSITPAPKLPSVLRTPRSSRSMPPKARTSPGFLASSKPMRGPMNPVNPVTPRVFPSNLTPRISRITPRRVVSTAPRDALKPKTLGTPHTHGKEDKIT